MQKPPALLNNGTSFAKSIGVSTAEYALILGLVVIVAIPALMMQGDTVKNQLATQTEQVSQLDQMTKLLQAPPAGYTSQSSPQTQALVAPNDGSPESVRSFLDTIQITESANGKLNVVGAGTNTTSSEGSTISRNLASQLEAMANNPEFQAEAKKIQTLAARARRLAELQDALKSNPNVDKYNALLNKAQQFQNLAQDFNKNKTLTQLNSIVLNIAKKNYLDPAQPNLTIEKETKSRRWLFGGQKTNVTKIPVERMTLDKNYNLKNFTKKANSTTTLETATKMETTPPALDPPSTQTAAG
jgi:Flp pilus assembly pilin Flp